MDQLKESHWLVKNIADTAQSGCSKSLNLLKATKEADFEKAVPQIRSNYKNLRAAFRLIRDDSKNYQKENEFYRDEAKKILGVQQALSMVQAIDLINQQYSDRLYKNAFTELRDKLNDHKKKQIESALNEEHIFQEMHQNLEGRCKELKEDLARPVSYATIESGLKRVYKRGRKAKSKLSDSPTHEDIHELQKRVNYLQIQISILEEIWPQMMEVWKDQLERLSHLLVTSESLNQLSEFLKTDTKTDSKENGAYLMNTLIEGHREQIQKHALLLGQKIYSLKPKHFIEFVRAAFEAHEMEGSQQILPSNKLKLS